MKRHGRRLRLPHRITNNILFKISAFQGKKPICFLPFCFSRNLQILVDENGKNDIKYYMIVGFYCVLRHIATMGCVKNPCLVACKAEFTLI